MVNLETWLTRFAAGAGTLFEWDLVNDYIVARLPAAGDCQEYRLPVEYMCPISAQATLETGKVYIAEHFYDAAKKQGLGVEDIESITDASDYVYPDYRGETFKADLRARIMRICRLEERA